MSGLSGYDAWKTATPYDDDDGEVECEACGGSGDAEHLGRTERCRRCDGTGVVLESDDEDAPEDDLSDAEADQDALEGAGFGSES